MLSDKIIDAILDEDIEQGAEELLRLVGAADGLQRPMNEEVTIS